MSYTNLNTEGKIFKDYTSESKVTVVKNDAKDTALSLIETLLKDNYTEVKYLGANQIGVVVGQGDDKEGGVSDVIFVIKVEAKNYYNSVGGKGRVTKPFRDEFDELADEYEFKREQKAIKAVKSNG